MLSRPGAVGRVGMRSRFAASAAAPLLASVQADGWQGVWLGGTPPTFDPDNNPVFQTFTRQGFDANATATNTPEAIPILRRVRNPYSAGNAHLTDTASNVALGDYILSTDNAAGVTNNSTERSPKPIANWVMRDRQLVGNSIDWEIVAFHYYARNNRQVACVRVRANDGTTQTPWQVVSSTSISSYCEDANPVEVYRGTLDITDLANGPVGAPALGWLEAEVYPWIGADNVTYSLSSVLKSEQETGAREFTRRYFGKSTLRAASPPLAYVASAGASPSGNDATGEWSTDATTAAGKPFLTVAGALVAMDLAVRGTPATNDIMDGCRIRIVDGVNLRSGTNPLSTRTQRVAALVVERAPGTSRAAAVATWDGSFRPRLGVGTLLGGLTEGAIVFNDMTLSRTGSFTMNGEATSQLQLHYHNCAITSTAAGQFLSNSHAYFYGSVMSGAAIVLAATTGLEKRILRGVVADLNFAATELFVTVGCNWTRPTAVSYAAANETRPFIGYSNKWINCSATGGVAAITSATNGTLLGGIAWVQNLIEATHTTSTTAGFRVSNDSPAYGSVTHAVVHHNTDTGYSGLNRTNILYDESPDPKSPPHKFASYVGNLVCQLNNKGDIWDLDAAKLAAFAFTHGVGCRGTFAQFATANPSNESQTYPGLAAKIGVSNNSRQNPLFTDYRGTGPETGTGGPIIGSGGGVGGGNYVLQGGSPARSMVAKPVLAFDLAGSARPTSNDAAGAYA